MLSHFTTFPFQFQRLLDLASAPWNLKLLRLHDTKRRTQNRHASSATLAMMETMFQSQFARYTYSFLFAVQNSSKIHVHALCSCFLLSFRFALRVRIWLDRAFRSNKKRLIVRSAHIHACDLFVSSSDTVDEVQGRSERNNFVPKTSIARLNIEFVHNAVVLSFLCNFLLKFLWTNNRSGIWCDITEKYSTARACPSSTLVVGRESNNRA